MSGRWPFSFSGGGGGVGVYPPRDQCQGPGESVRWPSTIGLELLFAFHEAKLVCMPQQKGAGAEGLYIIVACAGYGPRFQSSSCQPWGRISNCDAILLTETTHHHGVRHHLK